MQKQAVIRRSFWGNVLFTLGCAAFVVAGVFLLQSEDSQLIGVICIVFFGGGGLCYLILLSWKPIVIASRDGITIPHGWKKTFVLWKNIDRFEVVEQEIHTGRGGIVRQKYIGVFVFSKEGIVGAGKAWGVRGANGEVPAVLINLSFSFVKIEKAMKFLKEFHDNYKIANRTE